MVAVWLLVAAAVPSAAPAARYTVEVCNDTTARGDGIELAFGANTVGLQTRIECGPLIGAHFGIEQELPGNTGGLGSSSWVLRAPPGSEIARIEGFQEGGAFAENFIWEARNANAQLDRLDQARARELSYAVNSPIFTGTIRCTMACRSNDRSITRISDVVATMEDLAPPVAAVTPSPAIVSPVRGVVDLPFAAGDEGSGLRTVALLVDGAAATSASDPNGGRCVEPFRFLTPCSRQMNSSFRLDTSAFDKGDHQVAIRAVDASGQATVSRAVTIMVDNSPIAGPMMPGAGLPSPGAARAGAPTLSGLSLSPKRLKRGKRGKLSFTSSAPGTLTVSIAPVGRGAARRKVAKRFATITQAVAAGLGSVPIRTRVKGRMLRPGAYLLTATLGTADKRVSAPASLRFKVLRR